VLREAAARRFYSFIAESDGGKVTGSGAIWLQPVQPRPGARRRSHAPYILSMYTERNARNRGVASALVRAMLDWARKRGYVRITLHASRFGRPVYRKLGFEDSNEMRFHLVGEGRGRPASKPGGQ
jgi:GNAT superfamily N-acetyltransferase